MLYFNNSRRQPSSIWQAGAGHSRPRGRAGAVEAAQVLTRMLSIKLHKVASLQVPPHSIWATSWQNQQCGCAPSEDSDQPGLGIRPVWSESSLSAWRKVGSLATHWMHSEGSDQTGQMPRLIWVFVGRIATLLVLSWGGSFVVILSGH